MSMAKGSKKLDRRYADHLAAKLREIKRERFADNGTAFAKHLGMSQSQLSGFLAGGDRGVGIAVLIRLRAKLDVSLDDLIGLPPLKVASNDLENAVLRALELKFPAAEAKREPDDANKISALKRRS